MPMHTFQLRLHYNYTSQLQLIHESQLQLHYNYNYNYNYNHITNYKSQLQLHYNYNSQLQSNHELQLQITENSRQFMVNNPNSRLPKDYTKYPGKVDHTSVVCFRVGEVSLSYDQWMGK